MDRFSIVVLLCLYSSCQIEESNSIELSNQTTTKPTFKPDAFEIYDGTCKNYYIYVNDGEKSNPVTLSCASSAIFNSSKGECVPEGPEFTCNQTTITTPSTTSAPLCLTYGRFPMQVAGCKKYYLCYWNGVRYTIMNNLSCPNALVFHPMLQKCVSPQKYKCPLE